MKKIIAIIVLYVYTVIQNTALACEVCQKQQPKILQNVAHGAGPESNWDYVIVWSMVAITLFTLFFSIKLLVKPGEKKLSHIKYLGLNDE